MAATSFPPGPRQPAILQAATFARDPYKWILGRWRRYGDVFYSKFPFFGDLVYVCSPELVKEIFTGDPRVMHAGEANATALGPVLGTYSLLTLDDDQHLAQRKLLLPPFHGEAVKRYGELIEQVTERAIDDWPLDREFMLRDSMRQVTLEVILRAVFGVRGDERLREFAAAFETLADVSNVLVVFSFLRNKNEPDRLPQIGPVRRFRRALDAADGLIYDEIARRRAEPDAEGRDDVLSLLLSARHEDGSAMSDQELRDELMTLLAAGHETSATGLSWAFERLTRTPAALDRLLGDPEDDAYVDAVVKETLRIRPVIVDVARTLTQDVQVADWKVPAGAVVVPAITVLQFRPDLWTDPEEFRPERFLEGEGSERGAQPGRRPGEHRSSTYSWIPFGGGVRRCIGAAFAQFEMKIVLQTIARRTRLRAADPTPERPRVRNVTTVPSRGARVVLTERRPAGERPGVEAAAA